MHAAARFMLARIESGKGRGLAGIAKTARVNAKGQQQGAGVLTDARNGVEQLAFVFQIWVVVNVPVDLLEPGRLE